MWCLHRDHSKSTYSQRGSMQKRTSIDFMTSFESVQGEGRGGLKITKFERMCFLNGPIREIFEKRHSAKFNPFKVTSKRI